MPRRHSIGLQPLLVADDIGWLGGQKNNFFPLGCKMTLCSALDVATAVEIKLALLRIFVPSPHSKS
jgi:hypothetical protein